MQRRLTAKVRVMRRQNGAAACDRRQALLHDTATYRPPTGGYGRRNTASWATVEFALIVPASR
jgi:hypothetical protein